VGKRIAAVALLPRNDKGTDCRRPFTGVSVTKRSVILNAERERIRNTLRGEKRIAAHLAALAMTRERIAAHLAALAMTRDGKADCRSRLYIPPAGSVGAYASQRCPPNTRTFAMTKRLVILSAKHERIRNTLSGKTDCRGRIASSQ